MNPARWERALDAHTSLATRSFADHLARAVSIVCAPPVMMLPVAGLASWHDANGTATLTSVVTLVVTTAVLPTVFVYAAYLAGLISSPDMPRRAERLQPALFATLCAVAAYPLLQRIEAPTLFLSLDAALAVQMALLGIVTIWWKISYHAAGAAGLAMVAVALLAGRRTREVSRLRRAGARRPDTHPAHPLSATDQSPGALRCSRSCCRCSPPNCPGEPEPTRHSS